MKYMGSKNKLAKELVPIIQSYIKEDTVAYLEPFVGGANIIDKINHRVKIGSDIHKELISLLSYAKLNSDKLPTGITKDEYIAVRDSKDEYDDWYVGLVGFCASYNAKYFGGYAGECQTKNGIRHYDQEAINNLKKQSAFMQDINFYNKSFLDYDPNKIKKYVIYCDIPYKNSTGYETRDFPYYDFYQWCIEMAKNNTVLISEYDMPTEYFDVIWEKEHRTFLDNKNNNKIRIEKLFIVK